LKIKFLASPDRSGILFLASLARKRYSGWQEHLVLKKPENFCFKKITKKGLRLRSA
jgi:hypothetical protein